MEATTSYAQGLIQPQIGKHYVHLYQNDSSLIDVVSDFIGYRLDASEAAVVIATQAHNLALLEHLATRGMATQALMAQGKLLILDAEEELDGFMVDGMPDAQRFNQRIGGVLRKCLRHYKSVRAYGEMVNLLWQNDQKEAAEALEGLWNKLLHKFSFSLLCSYCMDDLDIANYGEPINCVCRTHTDFIGSLRPALLEQALAEAASKAMEMDFSGIIESLSRIPHPTTSMTPAQASLIFLSNTLPLPTQSLLEQVRMIVHQAESDNVRLT